MNAASTMSDAGRQETTVMQGTDRADSCGHAVPLRRRNLGRVTLAALALGLLAGCSSGNDSNGMATPASGKPPTLEGKAPSGTVDMREVQVAYIGNAGGGKGTLTYQGKTYPFIIAGLGVGGIGISTVDAAGEVYNLNNLAQFPGPYVLGQYGAVAANASIGDMWLENPHKVVLHLKAKREGLMLSVGGEAVDIRMDK
jgi:hypothetical protein